MSIIPVSYTHLKTVKKLKSGKKYYVKVRAYNGSGNNIAYGSWSKKKVVKVH